MRMVSFSLTFLLTPIIAAAQSSGSRVPIPQAAGANLTSVTAARLPALTGACPVGLRAQRLGMTSMVTVDREGKVKRENGPTVRLMLNNLQDKDIVAATIRV